jgi:hypothetical protein
VTMASSTMVPAMMPRMPFIGSGAVTGPPR